MMSFTDGSPEERKRLIILSALLGVIVLVGAIYFVFLSGGSSDEGLSQQQSTEAAPNPSVAATSTPEPTDPVTGDSTSVDVTDVSVQADPFNPLNGSSADASGSGSSSGSSSSSSSSSSSGGSKSSTQKQTTSGTSPTKTTAPAPKPTRQAPSTPTSSTPQLMKKATKEAAEVNVRMKDVRPDFVVVKVEGVRTKLFLAIPNSEGLKYVAQINSRCAWLGREGKKTRIEVCEGETEKF